MHLSKHHQSCMHVMPLTNSSHLYDVLKHTVVGVGSDLKAKGVITAKVMTVIM